MQAQEVLTVIGVSSANGTFDAPDGKKISYDFTKFHCIAQHNKIGAVGSYEIQHKLQGSVFFEKYKSLDFPSQLTFTFDLQVKGSKLVPILVSVSE